MHGHHYVYVEVAASDARVRMCEGCADGEECRALSALCGKNVLGRRDTVLVLRTSRKGFIMATLKLRKENICVRLGGTIQESMRCQNGSSECGCWWVISTISHRKS